MCGFTTEIKYDKLLDCPKCNFGILEYISLEVDNKNKLIKMKTKCKICKESIVFNLGIKRR